MGSPSVKPKPTSLPPGDFRLLIAAINRGVEREIVDDAARLARIAIVKLKGKTCRELSRKAQKSTAEPSDCQHPNQAAKQKTPELSLRGW